MLTTRVGEVEGALSARVADAGTDWTVMLICASVETAAESCAASDDQLRTAFRASPRV